MRPSLRPLGCALLFSLGSTAELLAQSAQVSGRVVDPSAGSAPGGAKGGKPLWEVRLRNADRRLAFMVQVKLIEDRSGKPVCPSFYSDNFVSLLPGEERVVTVETLSATPPQAHIEVEGWNVPRVRAQP